MQISFIDIKMLEEACGTATVKKMWVSSWHERIYDICVSVMIHAAGDCQLQQLLKTVVVCTVICEVTDKRVFRRYRQR
jgi:hypothetical protein